MRRSCKCCLHVLIGEIPCISYRSETSRMGLETTWLMFDLSHKTEVKMINVLISALIFVVEDEVNSNCTNTATPSRAHGTFIGFILVSLFLFYLHCYCLGEYIYSEASTPCSYIGNISAWKRCLIRLYLQLFVGGSCLIYVIYVCL
jgi:hypothetical protein